jgi:hypothetical protein
MDTLASAIVAVRDPRLTLRARLRGSQAYAGEPVFNRSRWTTFRPALTTPAMQVPCPVVLLVIYQCLEWRKLRRIDQPRRGERRDADLDA